MERTGYAYIYIIEKAELPEKSNPYKICLSNGVGVERKAMP